MTQAATLLEQAGDSAMKQKVKDVEEAFGFNPAPFSLEAIVSSKQFPPQKVVVYGVPGVGKTSFAATWPDPILLRTEDGAGALDVPTFPQVASAIADGIFPISSGSLDTTPPSSSDAINGVTPVSFSIICRSELQSARSCSAFC